MPRIALLVAENTPTVHPTQDTPGIRVAVQLMRHAKPNAWEDWRHSIADVALDAGQFGSRERLLRDDGRTAQTLFPGLEVSLHRDEAEGYFLNLASGQPVWFVVWRIDEEDPSRAWPEDVTVSYNEAARRMDAQERVDNVPLPPEVVAWVQSYVDEHYRPEPKKRRRPASFQKPEER